MRYVRPSGELADALAAQAAGTGAASADAALRRGGTAGAVRYARRRVFGLVTVQPKTEVAQDEVLHRGTGRCERVMAAGAEGGHGRLLTVSSADVLGTISRAVATDCTVRLSYS